MIKKLFITKLIISAMLLTSCETTTSPLLQWLQNNQATVNPLVSFGVSLGLKYSVTDPARRTAIANYADAIAAGVRTISGTPTPEQLTSYVLKFVPAKVRSDFPEIGTLVVPFIVAQYQAAYSKYGANAKPLYDALSQAATTIENGVAPYISAPHTIAP